MANMHLVTGYAGKTHVTSADHGSFWAAIIGNGDYVLDIGQKFAATIVSNNLVRIADGDLLMQGRHVRVSTGETVDLTIENGTADMLRCDLIVARYAKSAETGVEDANLVVISGTAAESSPADPEYTTGDILSGDLQRDFPLFRVNLDGITITSIDTLFTQIPGMLANNNILADELKDDIADLDDRVLAAETQFSALSSVATKIATGTYTGTGTYGEANATKIATTFTPKFVVVAPANGGITGVLKEDNFTPNKAIFWWDELTAIYTGTQAGQLKAVTVTKTDTYFKWYSAASAELQLNVSGTVYAYLIIG